MKLRLVCLCSAMHSFPFRLPSIGSAMQKVNFLRLTACPLCGGEPDLALEPVCADSGRQLRAQNLHDDLPSEPHLVGNEDAAHAAATELALDGVAAAQGCFEVVAQV